MKSDRFILNCVTGYKVPFEELPIQNENAYQPNIQKQNLTNVEKAVKKLVNKNAVVPCKPIKNQFLSPYFLRKKSNGEDRFILNLKGLNKFIIPQHFKMEDIKTALRLVIPDCYFATIDLKDGYLHISVYKKHRKFLGFTFEGKFYEFTSLPFGLCTAPYLFTKIMKPVIQKLREMGIVLVIYLDDILIIARSEAECKRNVKRLIRFPRLYY